MSSPPTPSSAACIFSRTIRPTPSRKKALRVNLSDLAAKGAKPRGFLLSLALPKSVGDDWLKAFARGLGADAKTLRLSAARRRHRLYAGTGDDLDHGVRHAAEGHAWCDASGARAGDHVIVTGTIGDAALGLQLRKQRGAASAGSLTPAMRRHLLARYLVPQPRNALAEALRRNASAAMDVSDGLVGDLGKLCRASGVGAEIDVARVPLSKAAQAVLAADPEAIETMLTGGDDFEVVATVPPRKLEAFLAAAAPRRRAGDRHRPRRPRARAPGSVGRTDGRSASRAPHSAIFDRRRRAIIAHNRTLKWGWGRFMHDITAIAAAMPGSTRSPNFLKHQRWYPTIYDLRRGAAKRLPHFAFEYGDGGAGDDTGIKHNWSALDAIEMVPRYGVMPELPPVNVELFGRKYTAPIGVAPMGSPIVVWPGADKLLAKAAQRARRALHAGRAPAARPSRRSPRSPPT